MRKVNKSRNVPASLAHLTPPSCTDDIDSRLYKGKDVKTTLSADQHLKCVYCECRLNGDYGDVEHYRPKARYSIGRGMTFSPGYYWLAYEWSNLLLSCTKCNRSFKADNFALIDERARDIAHRNIRKERPLLINPASEDPSLYLGFHEHIAVPRIIDGKECERGRYTIDLLRLNGRPDLTANRRKVWDEYCKWQKVKELALTLISRGLSEEEGRELLAIAESELASMSGPDAEYSAMFC